jgi:hypothetical protein
LGNGTESFQIQSSRATPKATLTGHHERKRITPNVHPSTAHDEGGQILEWAFGKRMTPAERLRKNQRMLDKAIRELDQTRVKLEKQEKTLIQQIKTSAKNGQMGACKIQAKDLVRTRRYIEKFYGMRSQLQKISLRLQVWICRLYWCRRRKTYLRRGARHLTDLMQSIDISNERANDAGYERCYDGAW